MRNVPGRKSDVSDAMWLADHFDQRDKQKVAKRLLKRLGDLGYEVEVKAAA